MGEYKSRGSVEGFSFQEDSPPLMLRGCGRHTCTWKARYRQTWEILQAWFQTAAVKHQIKAAQELFGFSVPRKVYIVVSCVCNGIVFQETMCTP